MGTRQRTLAALLALAALTVARASWAVDATVQQIATRFVSSLPADWTSVPGTWEYFDPEACFTAPTGVCYGNNPTSPYGFPSFARKLDGTPAFSFQMNPSEAVVVVFRTPPTMRYFSFAQYLVKRPADDFAVFASLSDSLNHLKIGTTGSQSPGTNVFNQYAAVVWTADAATYEAARAQLLASGLPEWAINFLPLPLTITPAGSPIPIGLGYGRDGNLMNLLMRTALPVIEAEFDAYRQEKPFFVVRVRPPRAQALSPAPVIGYMSDASGVKESDGLRQALDQLVADIRSRYAGRNYRVSDLSVSFTTVTGWDCIAKSIGCAADNHDALYSFDANSARSGVVRFGKPRDLLIIAGVNHQKTGKASYVNHSVYDTKKLSGIVSIADPLLTTQSALHHAGVSDPADPRLATYSSLYAYAISYDCTGISYCLAIPAPTAANPIGLASGSPFFVMGRKYLEPRTRVRPALSEITPHRTLLLSAP